MKPIPIVIREWFSTTFFNTFELIECMENEDSYTVYYDANNGSPYVWQGGVVSIQGKGYYTIIDIQCGSITITGDIAPEIGDILECENPIFIHGTQKKAKAELDGIVYNRLADCPIVYLQEIQSERFINDPESAIYSEAQLKLWFLLPSDGDKSITDFHYDLYVSPMSIMASNVVNQLEYRCIIAPKSEYTLVYHVNVGANNETGHLRELLNGQYSGVLLIGNFKMNKV